MSSTTPQDNQTVEVAVGGQKLTVPKLSTFALHVTVHIAPENVPAFFDAARPVYQACLETPELHSFAVFQDPSSPGALSWVEEWDASTEWLFEVQLQKDYYQPYFEVTEPMFVKPREFTILRRVDMTKDHAGQ